MSVPDRKRRPIVVDGLPLPSVAGAPGRHRPVMRRSVRPALGSLARAVRCLLAMAAMMAGTGGCSAYDPPVRADHGAEKYKTDLEACRTSVAHDVYIKNAGDIGTWIISPVTGPAQRREGVRACMAGKGYVPDRS